MKAITLTESIARAIAQDAAMSQMRKAGRKAWSVDDYNLACSTLEKLWPIQDPEFRAALARESGSAA